MKKELSILTITKNSSEVLERALQSVQDIASEIIVVDDFSEDSTVDIAGKYDAKVFQHHEEDLGKQKRYALGKAKGDWILVLDADEVVGENLEKEIRRTVRVNNAKYDGYRIQYQNYFLGRMLHRGGEDYKMVRLFRKGKGMIEPSLVHEAVEIPSGKIGELEGRIHHYSYRSTSQVFGKFTDYAKRDAKRKMADGEKVDFKKLFMYGPHMFWARFVEDRGYVDGPFRLPLDLAFAYMEGLTYWLLLYYSIRKDPETSSG